MPKTASAKPSLFERFVRTLPTPYYAAVATALGAITVVFALITALLILVTANFNLLGWME